MYTSSYFGQVKDIHASSSRLRTFLAAEKCVPLERSTKEMTSSFFASSSACDTRAETRKSTCWCFVESGQINIAIETFTHFTGFVFDRGPDAWLGIYTPYYYKENFHRLKRRQSQLTYAREPQTMIGCGGFARLLITPQGAH